MAPDSAVQHFSKRRSTGSSISLLSDCHDSLSFPCLSSEEDFERFLDDLDFDQLSDNSVGARQLILQPQERCCNEETSQSFEYDQSNPHGHSSSAHLQEIDVMQLQQWIDDEARNEVSQDPEDQLRLHRASIIRKITVGFGIGKLLQMASRSKSISNYSLARLKSMCSIDNFVVEFSKKDETSELGWELKGVVMVSPFSSLRVDTKTISNSTCLHESILQETMGRQIVAKVTCPVSSDLDEFETEDSSDYDRILCHLLGSLLHFIFTGSRKQVLCKDQNKVLTVQEEPLMKKRSSDVLTCDVAKMRPVRRSSEVFPLTRGAEFSHPTSTSGHDDNSDYGHKNESEVSLFLPSLIEFGYSFSLSRLVKNLVDCGLGLFCPDDAYPSLDVALGDMQVLLQQPSRFLWDYNTPQQRNLFMNTIKMYGRSREVALLTNAFLRVMSSGVSESVFIGGFSG
ncbi:hypothetical protein HJC23_002612 [Cyclotella cryptica]|uniref:Uncharacterized protein n=1 Tax=Cyclotella cryptica TaxID=29204 RepID=A0ABD3PXF9_9STRA